MFIKSNFFLKFYLKNFFQPRQFLNPKISKNEVLTPKRVFSGITTTGNDNLPQFSINHQDSTTSSLVGGHFRPFTPSSSVGHATASRKSSIETKSKSVGPFSAGAVLAMQEQQKERQMQQFKYDRMLAQQHRRRKSSGTLPSLLPPQTPITTAPYLLFSPLGTTPSVPPQTPIAQLVAPPTQFSSQLPALYLNVGYYENWTAINALTGDSTPAEK